MMKGLVNQGSSCFMNACLQMICSWELPFFQDVTSSLPRLTKKTPMYEELYSHIVTLYKFMNSDPVTAVVEPHSIRQCLLKWLPEGQQDAHECMNLLLDCIRESAPSASMRSHFSGILSTSIVCSQGHPSGRKDDSTILELSITEKRDLADSISAFYKIEELEEYQCVGCKKKVHAQCQIVLQEYPHRYFVVAVKRFLANGTKMGDPLTIPNEMTIDSVSWTLQSFIVHMGSAQGGHYICCYASRKGDEAYILADDKSVRKISRDQWDKLKSFAYLFAYQRRT